MKILCLFVRHGTEKHKDALAVLDRWYEDRGLTALRTLWIIDNALPHDAPPVHLDNGALLISGDNHAWEFSAWARALRRPELTENIFDVVHLVTSAFNTLYTRYLEHFHADMLEDVRVRGLCLGHIDSYDRPVEFAGNRSAHWIRTCFVFLPYSVAHQMNRWVGFDDPAPFFPEPDTTTFGDDAPLSRDYQNRIRVWLEGKEVGGHTWHSPIGSTSAEADRFQQKTLAILNEHSLSVRFRAMGLPLVDFCWWYTLRESRGTKPTVIPPEDEQLKIRRQILCIPEPPG
jgi:hypothetical protein